MTKLYPLLATVLFFAAICDGFRVRASPANPAVYDTKSLPGAMCRISACDFPVAEAWQIMNLSFAVGPHQYGPPYVAPAGFIGGQCSMVCPLVRDRYQDSVGPRAAYIEVNVPPHATQPQANQNRSASCRLVNTTGTYTVPPSVQVVNFEQAGPASSTPLPPAAGVRRLTLQIPYPNGGGGSVPSVPWANGATYANGYSSIVCTMPVGSSIEGYGWTEYAGETTDW